MPKLSDLIRDNERTIDTLTPSQTAMHALKVNDGILTYTKVLWNSDETIDMTDGSGFAYLGVEEFVEGKTLSGIEHNLIPPDVDEIGEKIILDKTYHIYVSNGNYIIDGVSMPALRLTRTIKYTFDLREQSTNGYPLYISTSSSGNNYSNMYLTGVANSKSEYGGTNDILTFVVPLDAPDTPYYASGNHANCFGKISIDNRDELTNLSNRKYDQVRFDNQKLTYYMNEDGFLVARYGKDYNYS